MQLPHSPTSQYCIWGVNFVEVYCSLDSSLAIFHHLWNISFLPVHLQIYYRVSKKRDQETCTRTLWYGMVWYGVMYQDITVPWQNEPGLYGTLTKCTWTKWYPVEMYPDIMVAGINYQDIMIPWQNGTLSKHIRTLWYHDQMYQNKIIIIIILNYYLLLYQDIMIPLPGT